MKILMREDEKKRRIRGEIIEAGYHVLKTLKRSIHVLNNQNIFLNSSRSITIIGVTEDVMNNAFIVDGEEISVQNPLIKTFQIIALKNQQPKQRTWGNGSS